MAKNTKVEIKFPMPPKNNPRNWNDVQTAIATVAIVATLGMWNFFATPRQKNSAQADQTLPPTEQPPVDLTPAPIPQVTIFFTTQTAPQSVTSQQPKVTKKNKNKGGGGTVTTTKTS